ncbi:hypothetical protein PTNB85_04647 [Pyrenophora teres f. teres]|uniref:Uncharacterized protein n=1 Tax=Pyrenophora teres f. teres TaxID=97479 RepID=A0A6S6VU02_9PLEO|nr:hypothetical protein PTNB85_04647 [Pyrenophora teres f. teres]KAE8862138.1 hypothetical protein PTNB29_04700 [Pyrenophora teres f. teres]CAE6995116.1 hypothetical protein PTTW11_00044 [Pyrenophora teres f. teres]
MIWQSLYLLLSLLLCHQSAAQGTPYPPPYGVKEGAPDPPPDGLKTIKHDCNVDLTSKYAINDRPGHTGNYECYPFTLHAIRNSYCDQLGNYLYVYAEVHDKGAWSMYIVGGTLGGPPKSATYTFAKPDYQQSRNIGCFEDQSSVDMTLYSYA